VLAIFSFAVLHGWDFLRIDLLSPRPLWLALSAGEATQGKLLVEGGYT